MERISSRQNPIVKRFREAAAGSPTLMLLDGPHLVEEALACGMTIDVVALREDGRQLEAIASHAERRGAKLLGVTEPVLAAMSPVRHPSGVVALAHRPSTTMDAVFERQPSLVLMLADVQDPGNVGAIVRAAEGCGATGVVTSEHTADAFGWKALRGSMGSAFRLPVAVRQPLAGAIRTAQQRGVRVYAAVPRDGTPLPRCDFRGPTAIVLGSEGAGVSHEDLALVDGGISIPMRRPVESLNVATAAALIAYEAMRQREGA